MACRNGTCGVRNNPPPAPVPQPAAQPQQFGNLGGVGMQSGQPITPQVMNYMGQPGQPASGPRAVPIQQPEDTRRFKSLRETPAQALEFQRYDPQQQNFLSQLLQLIGPELGKLIQQQPSDQQKMPSFDFAPIEAKAREDFTQKTIPSIMERFSGLGAQRSSAFGQSLSQAGSNLESNLGVLRSGHAMDVARLGLDSQGQSVQQQDLRQRLLLSLLGMGLGQKTDYAYQPRIPGPLENIGVGAAKGLPSAMMSYFGGAPAAAAQGADWFRSAFQT